MTEENALTQSIQGETGDYSQSSVQRSQHADNNSYLRQHFAEYTTSQRLEIEKARLRFLKACTICKRPPPSLRIKGASAIEDSIKLPKFSMWETELLNEAIINKRETIKKLNDECKNTAHIPLPPGDYNKMRKHFMKKISFYKKQDKTKWTSWPNKYKNSYSSLKIVVTETKKKSRNYKSRCRKKRKKTERNAKSVLDSGSVVVLINENIPLGAISLLGKGLNFITSPIVNPREEQLDMRLLQNKLLNAANKLISETANNNNTTVKKQRLSTPSLQNKLCQGETSNRTIS